MDQFPFEMIEIISIRATGRLFITINRTTQARAVSTMMAVSCLCYCALIYRKCLEHFLKRSFKRVRHPFECSSQHVTSLHIQGGDNVCGVVVFNRELCCMWGTNTIQVFDSRPPFSHREDINVQGLEYAVDNAVCSKSSKLYCWWRTLRHLASEFIAE